jgi:hypothetical protein
LPNLQPQKPECLCRETETAWPQETSRHLGASTNEENVGGRKVT